MKTKNISMLTLTAIYFLLLLNTSLSAGTIPEYTGYWKSKNGKNIIKMTDNSGKYDGTIVWLKKPLHTDGKPLTDGNNPDKANIEIPIIGLKILKNFVLNKNNELDSGTVYDPESGSSYSGIIKISGNNLTVRGYIGISLFGRTEVWHKIPNASDLPDELKNK